MVLLNMGTPILFEQSRPGLNSKTFKIYKFRTMTNKYDKNGNLLEDKERLSNFGSFLRSTSLDELPTLWNVVCGNMSFVGPRPLLIEYLPLYSKEQAKRHEVKPGITGLSQINGIDMSNPKRLSEIDHLMVSNFNQINYFKYLFLTLFGKGFGDKVTFK